MNGQQRRDRKARRWYFIKQKAMGLAMLIFSVLSVPALDGDATITLVTVPLGLCLLISKEMLIVNDYYFETKERKEEWYKY